MWSEIPGIVSCPKLASLNSQVGLKSDELVVACRNIEFFSLTRPIALGKSLTNKFNGARLLTLDMMGAAEITVGHGEVCIQVNSLLKQEGGSGRVALSELG